MASTSALDETTLALMRAEAATEAGPFVDPALIREVKTIPLYRDLKWLSWVIGRPVPTSHGLSHAELILAIRAFKADAEHLRVRAEHRQAAHDRAQRAAAEKIEADVQADRDRWLTIRSRLPVPVEVQHNWTARHLDGYEQGADHIVVLDDLNVGRLHRAASSPLCWTPSRARELRHVSGYTGDEPRLPDCKACLRHAERLAVLS
jgi:hypothetical protein